MDAYQRPRIKSPEFRNAAGNIIDYGNRWSGNDDGPSEDDYSVTDHLERFLPLHTVAEALIDYLVSNFRVDVDEDPKHLALLTGIPSSEDVDIVRTVQLSSQGQGQSPLVVVFTSFPGIWLYAGTLFEGIFPDCGCNACDETWESAAAELEWQVGAIVGGGFSESVSEPRRAKWSFEFPLRFVKGYGQSISYRLRSADGSQETTSESRAEDVPAEQLQEAQQKLAKLAEISSDGSWLPWTPVSGHGSDTVTQHG